MSEYFFDALWYLFRSLFEIQHKWFQRIEYVGASVIYFIFIFLSLYVSVSPIVVGALIGTYPIFLFVLIRNRKRPFLSIESAKFTLYPTEWYSPHLPSPKQDENKFNSAVCLNAKIINEGLETAEECKVSLGSDHFEKEYPGSWGENNQVVVNLAAGQSHRTELLWIMRKDGRYLTPAPGEKYEFYPNKEYPKITRYEIPNGKHQFYISVAGSNVPETKQQLEFNGENTIKLPQDAFELANDCSIVKMLKKQGSFAIIHMTPNGEILEIPENFDLNSLEGIGERFELSDPSHSKTEEIETFEETIKRLYHVERV